MKRALTIGLSVVLASAMALVGCSSQSAKEKTLKLAYVAWDSEIASTNVVKEVLESKLDYKVELLQVEAGPMWAGVADGSADAIVAAWLPTTHESYYTKYKDKFEDLGPNLDGTKIGLVVPEYMDISSIEDLKDAKNGEAVGFEITGIDPGAGLMKSTAKVIEEYGLDKWNVRESSSAAMAAALEKAYKNQKPIIVTGWTPHWKFAKFKLKYLEDPKNIYGGAEQIHTIARKDLKKDHPEAYALLDQFTWTPDDMAKVMVDIQGGMKPEEAAAKWVKENEAVVSKWVESAK
ncbi:glycine betaine ABC transporter substrate-binding protein [Paenibacillus turpanensis]|uniref:glycine betaine ABC transporter substrate-binding protein n=1 Tax=Paenibacillus turpanensis TaxID=2689078 RepID=UPI001408DEB9|nr:glycine betaine ABC transporter substrate-binding protein [Paenibacillus turpanensis]